MRGTTHIAASGQTSPRADLCVGEAGNGGQRRENERFWDGPMGPGYPDLAAIGTRPAADPSSQHEQRMTRFDISGWPMYGV